jgi:hypothetical protein
VIFSVADVVAIVAVFSAMKTRISLGTTEKLLTRKRLNGHISVDL